MNREAFIARIEREMPEGTIIVNPTWWAERLWEWSQQAAEPVAWLIHYTYQGEHRRFVSMHNALADYQDQLDPDATVTPLYALETP